MGGVGIGSAVDGDDGGLLSVDDDAALFGIADIRDSYRRGMLAGIASLAGRVADDDGVSRLIGGRFTDAMVAVHALSVRAVRGTVAGDGGRVGVRGTPGGLRVSGGAVAVRGGARKQRHAKAEQGGVYADLAALAMRQKIERQLRKMTREVEAWLLERETRKRGGVISGGGQGNGKRTTVRRCRKCARFGEDNWSWCPWDGGVMEEVDC